MDSLGRVGDMACMRCCCRISQQIGIADSPILAGNFSFGGALLCRPVSPDVARQIRRWFWYRDFKRLLVTTLFMGSLLMPIIVDAACAFISGHFRHSDFVLRPLYIGAAAVVTLAFAAVGFHYYSSRLSPTGDCVNGVGYAQLTDGDRAFFSKVSKVVGDKALLNSYNDSSVWLYSLYHVNALIKGRPANQISSMSDDLYEAVSDVSLAGSNSVRGAKVRASLRRLNVEYVLQYESQQNSTTKFKPNGQIDYQLAGKNSVVNDDTPGFEKVLTDGRYTLYKLHES